MTDQQKLNQEHAETWLAYHRTMNSIQDMINRLQWHTPKFKRLEAKAARLAKRGNKLNDLIS